jgi:hypothetical protein
MLQGLKPGFYSHLDVAAEAATYKTHIRDSL